MGPIKTDLAQWKLKRLAGELLSKASKSFSRNTCNDLEKPDYFSEEEWLQMGEEYQRWNSGGRDTAHPLNDWMAMSWLARLIAAGEI